MSIWEILLPITFAALAGGVTNTLAIWMLFHPYEPPALGRRPLRALQGAIPKNKQRLAAAIGRAVGTQLLTPEDVARALRQAGFRDAFEARLRELVTALLDRERGPLATELPPGLAAELRALLGDVARHSLERLHGYLATDEFARAAERWARALAEELEHRPIADVLTPEREEAIAATAERWLSDAVRGAGFESAVGDYLDRWSRRLLEPGRTFEELLPVGLVSAVEKAIGGYLPIAIERLGGMLDDPRARAGVERVLHEVLDRFMLDLRFHQRLVAALVITPETIDRVLRAVEAEGAAKISELLQEPEVKDAMAKSVNSAVVDFLRRPVRSVLGGPEEASVADAQRTVQRWVLDVARDPHTANFLIEKLKSTLGAAERRTWGDLFQHVPPERFAEALVGAARSERAFRGYGDAVDALIGRTMERPIGRPAEYLPADAPARIQRGLGEPLWSALLEQTPAIVERVEIGRRVEEKILDFPPQRIERLIRGVTERELKLIVRLGYVLGALIGGLSVCVSALLR